MLRRPLTIKARGDQTIWEQNIYLDCCNLLEINAVFSFGLGFDWDFWQGKPKADLRRIDPLAGKSRCNYEM
jgi:hypothetical protein